MKKLTLPGALLAAIIFFTSHTRVDNDSNVIILEKGMYFNGKEMAPFGEIVLKDGMIAAVNSKITQTKGKRVPAEGKYVIPGLTDAHQHLSGSPAFPYVMVDPKYNANSDLICGVTMAIDLFYPENAYRDMRKQAFEEPQHYSTLLMSGPILTAPGGHGTEYGVPTRTMTTPEEAKKITKEVIEGGVDVIKLVYEDDTDKYIPSISIDVVKAIVEVAHGMKKKVFAHIDRAGQAVACAEAGVDVLAHMPMDSLTDDQLKRIKKTGVLMVPTYTVLQLMADGQTAAYMSDDLLWKTAHPDYLAGFKKEELPKRPMMDMMIRKFYHTNNFHGNMRRIIAYKIPLLAGTDAGNTAVFYGYSLHNEIAQYVAAGMSPADALNTATGNIEKLFPLIKTGRVEAGYAADLVVLDADPLKDIANTKKINAVYHKGVLAEPLKMEKSKEVPDKVIAYEPAMLAIKEGPLPEGWGTFTDQMAGGTSEIKGETGKDGDAVHLHLTGKVVMKGFIGFAGFSIGLVNEDKTVADISAYKAVEFEVKGNGETYYLSVASSLVKDYNYHTASFTTTPEWKTVNIPFSSAKQNPYYGKQLALDLKTIVGLSFSAMQKSYPIDLYVRNIRLVK